MKKSYILYVLVLLISTFCFRASAYAQQKIEQEMDVEINEVPANAKDFIKNLPFRIKPNWFYEINEVGHSYEAKFKYKKRLYSIEFDTTGRLLDVEIQLTKRDIDKKMMQQIDTYFQSEFSSYSIGKIQLQLGGDEDAILKGLNKVLKKIPSELQQGYEIVVNGKKSNYYQPFEVFFDISGKALSIVQIKLRNTDHLEY